MNDGLNKTSRFAQIKQSHLRTQSMREHSMKNLKPNAGKFQKTIIAGSLREFSQRPDLSLGSRDHGDELESGEEFDSEERGKPPEHIKFVIQRMFGVSDE